MRVLVTGGAGYIGSTVVRELITAGDEAIVLDNLSQGHRMTVPQGVPLYKVDLADAQTLDKTVAECRPDAILHFASNTLVGESVEQPFKYLRDNLTNGLNLIQSAIRHGVGRFILSSTANLFGEPPLIPIVTVRKHINCPVRG